MSKGICQRCDLPVENGIYYCSTHREEVNAERRQQEARKPRDQKYYEQARRWNLKQTYGDAAVQLWEDKQGTCESCGYRKNVEQPQEHALVRVHVHHLDRDPTNNTRENLALLCSVCHRKVHALLEATDSERVLAWVATRYPSLHLKHYDS